MSRPPIKALVIPSPCSLFSAHETLSDCGNSSLELHNSAAVTGRIRRCW
jgi:hypothetical protein